MSADIIIKNNGTFIDGRPTVLAVPQTPEAIASFSLFFTCGHVSKKEHHYGFFLSDWAANLEAGFWMGYSVAMEPSPE